MLVLTRREEEKIIIDGGIEITILKIKGQSVRIGVTAPTETKVVRSELMQCKK